MNRTGWGASVGGTGSYLGGQPNYMNLQGASPYRTAGLLSNRSLQSQSSYGGNTSGLTSPYTMANNPYRAAGLGGGSAMYGGSYGGGGGYGRQRSPNKWGDYYSVDYDSNRRGGRSPERYDRRRSDNRRGGDRRSPKRPRTDGGSRYRRSRSPHHASRDHRDTRHKKRIPKPVFDCPVCTFTCAYKDLFDWHYLQRRHESAMGDVKEIYRLQPENFKKMTDKVEENYNATLKAQEDWLKAKQERKAKKDERKSTKDKWWCEICDDLVERKVHVEKHKDDETHKTKVEALITELSEGKDDDEKKVIETSKKEDLDKSLKESYKECSEWSDFSGEEDNHEERDKKQLERENERIEKRKKEEEERIKRREEREAKEKEEKEAAEKAKKEKEEGAKVVNGEKIEGEEDKETVDEDKQEGDEPMETKTDGDGESQKEKTEEASDKTETKEPVVETVVEEPKREKSPDPDRELFQMQDSFFRERREMVRKYGREKEYEHWRSLTSTSSTDIGESLVEPIAAHYCAACDAWLRSDDERALHLRTRGHFNRYRSRMMEVTVLNPDQRRMKDHLDRFLGLVEEKPRRKRSRSGSYSKSTKDRDGKKKDDTAEEMVVVDEEIEEDVNGVEAGDVEDIAEVKADAVVAKDEAADS